MWALRNRTPYAADRNWTRDKNGAHWWIVAVRSTFSVGTAGRLTLLDEQPPPVLEPEYFGEPGQSSLRYSSDLLAVKPSTDVLVVAHAHAPGGRPAATVPVVLRAGTIDKQLVVHGERVYYDGPTGLATTKPRPFTSRPIRYELAFGGSDLSDPDPSKQRLDERNPVGRGIARRSADLVNKPAHAIEYAGSSKGPAGLGPIDQGWMPRRKYAGTYDAKWVETRKPLLPEDYDPRFAMSAPEDQQTEQPLVGGEQIGLFNVTPDGAFVCQIPSIDLEFTTHIGKRREQHGPRLTTVLVEPEQRLLSVVWQSVLRVHALDLDYLDATEIAERGRAA